MPIRTNVPSGLMAPEFKLPAAGAGDIALEDYRGRAAVVLVFLRSRR